MRSCPERSLQSLLFCLRFHVSVVFLMAALPAAEAAAAAEVPAAGDNPVAPAEEAEMTVRELQNQLMELKRTSASNSVGAALLSLQQELAKPPPVFDPTKLSLD